MKYFSHSLSTQLTPNSSPFGTPVTNRLVVRIHFRPVQPSTNRLVRGNDVIDLKRRVPLRCGSFRPHPHPSRCGPVPILGLTHAVVSVGGRAAGAIRSSLHPARTVQ